MLPSPRRSHSDDILGNSLSISNIILADSCTSEFIWLFNVFWFIEYFLDNLLGLLLLFFKTSLILSLTILSIILLFRININRIILLIFTQQYHLNKYYITIFASVTNHQAVAQGYKNGCHGINRDFVRTKIVPAANIVTSILIS